MIENFVSSERRGFRYRLGNTLASSLSGFIAGAVVATIILGGALVLARVFGY